MYPTTRTCDLTLIKLKVERVGSVTQAPSLSVGPGGPPGADGAGGGGEQAHHLHAAKVHAPPHLLLF